MVIYVAKITYVIINSIQRVKAIKEREDKRFVELVDVLEVVMKTC